MAKRSNLPFSLDPLDPRLVLPKPKNSVEDDKIFRLEQQNRLIFTRKRDGHGVSAVITDNPKIYTRGSVRDISENFPMIIKELKELGHLKNTLLCCELVAEKDGSDWREYVASLTLSLPHVARDLQERNGYPKLMVYNMLVDCGKDISQTSHEWRIACIQLMLEHDFKYLFPVETLKGNFNQLQKRIVRQHWEGMVIYDREAVSAYRLDGNSDRPPRPEGCWKRKPSAEDDFVAIGFVTGTAGKRHEHRMGKLILAQVHPKSGELVPCGEVGIGFSDQEREELADNSLYPFVVQVEYERRFSPRQLSKKRVQCALCNPRFVRRRDDKTVGACLLPKNLAGELTTLEKQKGTK